MALSSGFSIPRAIFDDGVGHRDGNEAQTFATALAMRRHPQRAGVDGRFGYALGGSVHSKEEKKRRFAGVMTLTALTAN